MGPAAYDGDLAHLLLTLSESVRSLEALQDM
jgi:hypothetical protein